MTKQEFIERTGYTSVSDEEYKAIEMIYIEAGESVDKDLFCKEWLEHKDSNLFRIFYHRAMEMQERAQEAESKLRSLAKFLIKKSDENADSEEYQMAVSLVGRKNAVLFKVQEQIELAPEDIEYILKNLQ